MAAGPLKNGRRGKSGLHKATVPGNARPGQPEGKRHRKQTAPPCGARVKRWGKSPPRDGQPDRHGKPHREQCRIGIARGGTGPGKLGYRPQAASWPGGPGWQLEASRATACREEWSSKGAPVTPPGQNPAYRPSAHIYLFNHSAHSRRLHWPFSPSCRIIGAVPPRGADPDDPTEALAAPVAAAPWLCRVHSWHVHLITIPLIPAFGHLRALGACLPFLLLAVGGDLVGAGTVLRSDADDRGADHRARRGASGIRTNPAATCRNGTATAIGPRCDMHPRVGRWNALPDAARQADARSRSAPSCPRTSARRFMANWSMRSALRPAR